MFLSPIEILRTNSVLRTAFQLSLCPFQNKLLQTKKEIEKYSVNDKQVRSLPRGAVVCFVSDSDYNTVHWSCL